MSSESPPRKILLEYLEALTKILANIGGVFVSVAVTYVAYALNELNINRDYSTRTTQLVLKYEDTFIKLDAQRREGLRPARGNRKRSQVRQCGSSSERR